MCVNVRQWMMDEFVAKKKKKHKIVKLQALLWQKCFENQQHQMMLGKKVIIFNSNFSL